MPKPSQKQIRAEILALLAERGTLSHLQYAAAVGISQKAAYQRLYKLWDDKSLYVARWERGKGRGQPTPFYAIGRCADAPRLKPLTNAELQRAYRASEHGKAVKRRHEAITNAAILERRRTDPAYAEEYRRYQREWAAKKHGTQPQVFRNVRLLDEVAMQFGITWRFAGRKQERKAA
jgi:predicted ArsR family transcriptional regulator